MQQLDVYEKDMIAHGMQIHQTHVKSIVEAPPLKDGTGKEIRTHDLVIQHLRALKALSHDPSPAFITNETRSHNDV